MEVAVGDLQLLSFDAATIETMEESLMKGWGEWDPRGTRLRNHITPRRSELLARPSLTVAHDIHRLPAVETVGTDFIGLKLHRMGIFVPQQASS